MSPSALTHDRYEAEFELADRKPCPALKQKRSYSPRYDRPRKSGAAFGGIRRRRDKRNYL